VSIKHSFPSPDTAVLRPRGRLDLANANHLKDLVDEVVQSGHRVVVVDLDRTTFLDSSGLGALVRGLRTARAAGGDLRICGADRQVRTVLELTTMDRVLRPHASVAQALADVIQLDGTLGQALDE
jgi:anti-sigma B factor antagonist